MTAFHTPTSETPVNLRIIPYDWLCLVYTYPSTLGERQGSHCTCRLCGDQSTQHPHVESPWSRSPTAGIHVEPPWGEGGHSPQENLAEGLRVLAEMTGAATPDILVLSCNLWSVLPYCTNTATS